MNDRYRVPSDYLWYDQFVRGAFHTALVLCQEVPDCLACVVVYHLFG